LWIECAPLQVRPAHCQLPSAPAEMKRGPAMILTGSFSSSQARSRPEKGSPPTVGSDSRGAVGACLQPARWPVARLRRKISHHFLSPER
jgi:hypothetical protein